MITPEILQKYAKQIKQAKIEEFSSFLLRLCFRTQGTLYRYLFCNSVVSSVQIACEYVVISLIVINVCNFLITRFMLLG